MDSKIEPWWSDPSTPRLGSHKASHSTESNMNQPWKLLKVNTSKMTYMYNLLIKLGILRIDVKMSIVIFTMLTYVFVSLQVNQ